MQMSLCIAVKFGALSRIRIMLTAVEPTAGARLWLLRARCSACRRGEIRRIEVVLASNAD